MQLSTWRSRCTAGGSTWTMRTPTGSRDSVPPTGSVALSDSGGRVEPFWCRSDGERQLIEGHTDSMVEWYVCSDLVVATSDVVDEGMTGGKGLERIGTS